MTDGLGIGDLGDPGAEECEMLDAARAGKLAEYLDSHGETGYSILYALVAGLVYEKVTRPNARRRGHDGCAASRARLDPECHDRHQDDVDAVYTDLLRHRDLQFANLRGWLVPRLGPVTVDAHRRRRGAVGALQRPRLPQWLITGLDAEPWLLRLALDVLDWVGVTATAADGLWPLHAWARRRAEFLREPCDGTAAVARDVERVLAAMRARPAWFAAYVERPLGHKQAPLAPGRHDSPESAAEPDYVACVEPDETVDGLLRELARAAVESIGERVRRGARVPEAVAEVLSTVFGSVGSAAEDMDGLPGRGKSPRERAAELILEAGVVDRVVEAVTRIIEGEDSEPEA
jgi:hypothetical protein